MHKILTAALLLLCLPVLARPTQAGVIDFMPKEIRDAERPSLDGAKKLEAEHPGIAHSYTVNGRSIYYVELKQDVLPRPLIIFVHGSPGLWRTWVRYLNDPDLQRRANMIAMDRPGFGQSGSGKIERGFLRQSEALAPLLSHKQPGQRVILVGHALGAALAMRLAMAYPEQVTDLVLTAAPLNPVLQTESWFQYPANWPPVTWLLPAEIVVFNREYLGLKKQLTEMLPLWPRITQRVSLLFGEQDAEVPIANADFAQAMLIRARSLNVVRLPQMNHFIPWTRYENVKAEILAHIDTDER